MSVVSLEDALKPVVCATELVAECVSRLLGRGRGVGVVRGAAFEFREMLGQWSELYRVVDYGRGPFSVEDHSMMRGGGGGGGGGGWGGLVVFDVVGCGCRC